MLDPKNNTEAKDSSFGTANRNISDPNEIEVQRLTEGESAADMSRRNNSLLGDDEVGNINVELANDSHPAYMSTSAAGPPSNSFSLVPLPYWRSRDFKELCACVLFALACYLATVADYVWTERPIPFQLLSNGDYVRNLSNNEIYDGETVPDTLLIVLAIILPVILQLMAAKLLGERGDVHATLCIYLVALSLTLLATDLLKIYCAYLRPIFYAICEPDEKYETCTGDTGSSESYRRSFPSGHASTSFCGLTLLTLFIHTRFGVPCWQRKQLLMNGTATINSTRSTLDPLQYRFISIFSLIPMGVASFIAASRVVDNKHFPADVITGTVLGASIAIFIHGLWL
jgi:diacylglycerol diphosphate phosphatase / phosphatidate phosphatase